MSDAGNCIAELRLGFRSFKFHQSSPRKPQSFVKARIISPIILFFLILDHPPVITEGPDAKTLGSRCAGPGEIFPFRTNQFEDFC